MAKQTITLNPDSEFEAALIEMVEMHRERGTVYDEADAMYQNIIDAAYMSGVTPLQAAEVLLNKHAAALKKWDGVAADARSDDAYLDRAVYACICLVLYKRWKAS